jgi:uncharacterized protein (TIGR00730 family)
LVLRPSSRAIYHVWNTIGFIDILFVVITATRLAFADSASMTALLRLPLSLRPTFVVPLVIFTHVVIFLALSRGGRVTGVMPTFMNELEWGHRGLTELLLVEDMHSRKRRLLEGCDAVVALPGGCGTLEELLEVITLKRLGLFLGPIVLVNTRHFFDPLLQLLASAIQERFMDPRHQGMWQVVSEPEHVANAFTTAQPWSASARCFATQ